MRAYSVDLPKREFECVNENELFHTFFQDEVGFIWAGTAHSLYRYDGKQFCPIHLSSNLKNRTIIVYQILKSKKGNYYIATNKGLGHLDISTHRMELIKVTANIDVRRIMESEDGDLLLGTMTGLYLYYIQKNILTSLKDLPNSPINDIVHKSGSVYWTGNSSGIYEIDSRKLTVKFIHIKGVDGTFATAIKKDTKRHILWLGTENGLFGYDWTTGKASSIQQMQHNTVSSLLLPGTGKNIWLGTDNGLYIYNPEKGDLQHYVHNTHESGSLINNVVDYLFEDRDGNIWIGTNCGASVFYMHNPFKTYLWEDLVLSDEGNRIQCIYEDSKGNYWCGGTNGLGRYNLEKGIHQWYRMNSTQYNIVNNRVHQLFEDKEGSLWISTDGGIHRFDYEKNRFYHYHIIDSLKKYDANWIYGIFDDEKGNLWIASYLKGLFRVNKSNIKKQDGGLYIADKHLCQKNGGLLSDKVCYATIDRYQNIWASTNQNGVHWINGKTGQIVFYSEQIPEHRLGDNNVNCIIADKKGYVWVAEESGIDRIDIKTGKIKAIINTLINNRRIDSLVDLGEWLGIVSGENFFLFNKDSENFLKINLDGKRDTCARLDRTGKIVLLGGVDQILELEWRNFLERKNDNANLLLASLRVMNQDIQVGEIYQNRRILGKDINLTKRIDLDYNINGFDITVCENKIRKISNRHYYYRLKGLNDEWTELENIPSNLSFYNLQPGKYLLQLKEGNSQEVFHELEVVIHAPWYATNLAKIIYILIILLWAGYLLREYQIRNRLKIENMKKEKTLELSKMKMEFLTNISHELKTPLSLIMGPLGDILPDVKNGDQKRKVQIAYNNSIKLNSLVHQILDYKEASDYSDELHKIPLELIEFVNSIALGLKDAFDAKQIKLNFETHYSRLYVEADVVKMESVFTNILSNSLKYSLQGDLVNIHITSENKMAIVQITDTGVGIPEQDLSHVFARFYQSEQNRRYNNEGSGIGLSLVKRFVELHTGKVELVSEEGKGTTVSVWLPLSEQNLEKLTELQLETNSSKRIILVVEDNEAIADYICSSFKNYFCLVAHNGRYGLDLAQKNHPDLIIADIMMPVMDGLDLLKALKKNIETALIPVIMLTAKDNFQTESQALSLGADIFVSKPFDIELLKLRVEKIIYSKQQMASKLRQKELVQSAGMTLSVEESQNEKFLNEINQIIESQLENTELNVQKLAEFSGFSSKQIYRKLKELTGHTAVDYIKSIRLKKAAFLLSQRKFTVSEVMYMVGFSNSSYFSKCFAEMYGKTPKQYMS